MKKFLHVLRTEFTYNQHSFVNSLKTTLACLIGLTLTQLLALEQPQWVLISVLIVMASQYRLGGAMIKGYARLFATAIGSLLASGILFLFPGTLTLIYSCLFICITVFIYLASNSKEFSYSYTLGAVTMVIIVLSNNSQLHSALDRMIEIMIGVITAILVSCFVFPIRAEKVLCKNIASTLRYLEKVYQLFIRDGKTLHTRSEGTHLENSIIQNFANQPLLLKEACTESLTIRKQKGKYLLLLQLERQLLRTIYMLQNTLSISLKSFSNIINMQAFKMLDAEIIAVMEALAAQINNTSIKQLAEYNLNKTYDQIMQELQTRLDYYSFEEKNNIHAFIFCLGHVITILNKIQKVLSEIR